jgi:hypothetical protein
MTPPKLKRAHPEASEEVKRSLLHAMAQLA